MAKIKENSPLSPVKSLLLTFEGKKVSSSITVNHENYKSINTLLNRVKLETGSNSPNLISAIEENEHYDFEDCLFTENQKLDVQFLEKVFSDPIIDDKLNLLIAEDMELTMDNLDAIEEVDPAIDTEVSFSELIHQEIAPELQIENTDKWLDEMHTKGEIIGMTASNGKIIYAFCESIKE